MSVTRGPDAPFDGLVVGVAMTAAGLEVAIQLGRARYSLDPGTAEQIAQALTVAAGEIRAGVTYTETLAPDAPEAEVDAFLARRQS